MDPSTLPAEREAPGLLQSAWRFRRMSALVVIVFVGLSLAAAELRSKRTSVTATARIALTDPRGNNVFRQGSSAGSDLVRFTAERAAFARSAVVLERASRLLGGVPLREIEKRVRTSSDPEENLVTISAETESPLQAARIANAVADAYRAQAAEDTRASADNALQGITEARQRVITSLAAAEARPGGASPAERTAATQVLSQLDLRASETSINAVLYGAGVNFIDRARPPAPGGGTSPLRAMAAGGLLGSLVAVVLAWIRADRFQTADGSDVAAPVVGVPLLGEVPELRSKKERWAVEQLTSMPADAYQFVSASLRSMMGSGVLLVTSANRLDGRTVTAASIAAGAAREGRRVALVDGDTRERGLTKLLGARLSNQGLSDLAAGTADETGVVRTARITPTTALSFIPAGTPVDDVASLFRTDGMAKAIYGLRAEYDLVVVDCPPFSAPEAAALTRHADGILLVVRCGTPLSLLETTRRRLELFPITLVGYVFTRSRSKAGLADAANASPQRVKEHG